MLKIVFGGTNNVSLDSLKVLYESKDIKILKVYTNPDKPHKRSKKLIPSPVKAYCIENNIDVTSEKPSVDELHKLSPDLGIAVSFGVILTQEVLGSIPNGWINLHFSLLPKYRGPAPVQYSLLNGDKSTGLTIFQIVKEIDAGPILVQKEIEIVENENASLLLDRLSKQGAEFLLFTILGINFSTTNWTKQLITQNDDNQTMTYKLIKNDGELDFENMTVDEIINKVRAYSNNPGAYFIFQDKRIVVDSVKAVSEWHSNIGIKPPQFICKDGVIELLKVKPEGKNWMDAKSWSNGIKANGLRSNGSK